MHLVLNSNPPLFFTRFAHKCSSGGSQFKIAPKGKSHRIGDDIVVLNTGEIVQVDKEEEEGKFSGLLLCLARVRVGTMHFKLPWHKVGVHLYEGVDITQRRTFHRREARCKALVCGNYVYEMKGSLFMSKADV